MISSRFSSAESRLLRVSLENMGGIKYNSRNTEINAANQAAQRQAQIAAGQKMIADNPQGLATNVNNLAPPVTGVPKQQLNQSGFQTYDATTGKTTVAAPLGEIDQAALKRLMDSGMTEGQARERITSLRPEVATTMSNTGLGGTARQSAVVTPQSAADKAESDVRARYSRATATGSSVNPADVERDVQTARQNALKQAEIEQNNTKMQKDKEASTAGTDVTTPKPSGLEAALSSLSPEEQSILAPLIQNLQDQTTKGLEENAARTKAMLEGGTIDGVQVEGINTIRDQLKSEIDGMKDDRKTMKDAVAEILKETKEDNEKLINEQEKAAQERLTWAQHKQEVDLARQKTKTHESLIAQYALGGGFGQDAALTQVRESDASFDSALRDVQTEFGIQRTELSAKFTGLYVANNNEYRTASIKNAEDYLSALERLNAQGGQNTVAFMNAQNGIIEKAQAEQRRLTENLAKSNMEIGVSMLKMIGDNKTAKAQKEKDALAQIDYLSKNFEPAAVADQIRELAKDVTSFDAGSLAGQPPIAMQLALKKLGKGSGTGGGGLGTVGGAAGAAPIDPITYDAFVKKMITAQEEKLGMSMSPEARKEYLDANKANILLEYNHQMSTNPDMVQSSGNAQIDEAARLVYEGTIPSVAEAAKKLALPYGQIAQQVSRLQKSGVSGGFTLMNDDQQKAFLKLNQSMNTDQVVQYARSVPNKVTNILHSLDQRSGVADLAAINSLQNGLIDPGVSVRSDDINLITKEAAPLLSKFNSDYWKKRLTAGGILPEAERQQIRDLANKLQEDIVEVYQNTVFERYKRTGQALGIPEKNLNILKNVDYSEPDQVIRTQDEEYGSPEDTELDNLLASYGY